jgi:hypothetical protein
VLILSEKIDLDEVNAIDMNAKKVLEALAGLNKGEFANGEKIQQLTGLIPDIINNSIRALEKSLLIDNPSLEENIPPYDFYAVEITDFGRQVLEQYV